LQHLTSLLSLDGEGLGQNVCTSPYIDRGEIDIFLLLEIHFLPEKERFLWDTTQKTETSQKNKLRFVARPKLSVWLFTILEVMQPPP
jgi:hypothetical protein